MSQYRPVYCRPPNKLLKYVDRPFNDGAGNSGIERVAVYSDKHGGQCEMTAQMIWDEK